MAHSHLPDGSSFKGLIMADDWGGAYASAGIGAGLKGIVDAYKWKKEMDAQEQLKQLQIASQFALAQPKLQMQQEGLDLRKQFGEQMADVRERSLEERSRANLERESQAEEMRKLREMIANRPRTAINPATGEMVEVPHTGFSVTPPGAADAQKQLSALGTIENIVDMQLKKLDKLPQGRVYGRMAKGWNALTGYMPDVGEFEAIHEALIPQFTRVIGGDVGNLTEQEQRRGAEINPNMVRTPEEARKIANFLKDVIKVRKGAQQKILGGGLFPSGKSGGIPLPQGIPNPTQKKGWKVIR